ncbi:MAG: caspase family protein [Rhodobacteraceae bacterium]|nr:caspase family protein [Paracoccaceae bacterium]
MRQMILRLARTLAALAALAAGPAMADRALVVGIDAYLRDPAITPLSGAVNDARSIRRFLIEHAGYAPDEVLMLTDAEATAEGIRGAIRSWLIEGTRPGDRAFFFFAGHGYQTESLTIPGELDQILISVDTHLDGRGVLRDFVRDKELDALLRQLEDRVVTVAVDSCHSGLVTRSALTGAQVRAPQALRAAQMRAGTAPPPPMASRSTGGARSVQPLLDSTPDRTVWAAVSPHQLAFEQGGEGLFTSRFIRGIAEGAADLDGDGVVTHLEMHTYLARESEAFCPAMPPGQCGLGLTPMLEVYRPLQGAPVDATLRGDASVPGGGDLAGIDWGAVDASFGAGGGLVPVAVSGATGGASGGGAGTTQGAPAQGGAPGQGVRVTLDILPSARPRRGERVQFRIDSSHDGYLIVFDITPDGRLVQLFPNRFSDRQGRGNTIRAGLPLTIPDATYGFDFVVQPPLGQGRLVGVVTAHPVDFSDIATAPRHLIPVPAGADVD